MEEIKTQLSQEIADVAWESIKPHAQRDAVIVVNSGLDLIEVGMAIAEDRTMTVQHWIAEALIRKPSAIELSQWNDKPSKEFSALIIQPFVLVQEV
jgi:hypothetical protein